MNRSGPVANDLRVSFGDGDELVPVASVALGDVVAEGAIGAPSPALGAVAGIVG